MQSEILTLKQRLIFTEAQSKRSNLIFEGLTENHPQETWEDCENKIHHLLANNLDIPEASKIKFERVHRLGYYKPGRNVSA